MDRWTDEGTEPPESQYGLIEKGTLVTPENLDFPKIPGVERSTRIHKAYRADYGPKFRSEGIVTEEPPEIGRAYPMMVPAVNEDGNEIVGIQMPEHSVPLATHTGWNLFNADAAPPTSSPACRALTFRFQEPRRSGRRRTIHGPPSKSATTTASTISVS